MKLDYHPPHLILIHFPAALFPMDLVCSAIALYRQDQSFNYAAFYALGGGVLVGWLAVMFGFVDLSRIPAERKAALNTGLIHGSINTVMLIGYSVLFFLQWRSPEITYATVPLLLLKGVLLLLLIVGNYLGAQLLLKHKIGILNHSETPQPGKHA
ncbi:DUF2231 domain-containing protein [Adhaeribacter soli]|uniref:DUF2231 domain-containing protein n=1 Tax=Adhaeribacter soli TaxID=2607655 RepID=A0A5N1IUQ5_9BACT|nr:DUF2231 domain-containing protein [Adhaeribacter soli]KAA9331780.1 DUF2231 domain-containing protein [Adhaeribacter soli]